MPGEKAPMITAQFSRNGQLGVTMSEQKTSPGTTNYTLQFWETAHGNASGADIVITNAAKVSGVMMEITSQSLQRQGANWDVADNKPQVRINRLRKRSQPHVWSRSGELATVSGT